MALYSTSLYFGMLVAKFSCTVDMVVFEPVEEKVLRHQNKLVPCNIAWHTHKSAKSDSYIALAYKKQTKSLNLQKLLKWQWSNGCHKAAVIIKITSGY